MEQPNIKGLGKKQLDLLRDMAFSGNVIRMVVDFRRDREAYCMLEDDDGANSYESYPCDFVENLNKRNLFKVEEFNPCVGMDIITFRLRNDVLLPKLY